MIQETIFCNRKLPFGKDELQKKIEKQPDSGHDGIRMLFLPARMTRENVDDFCYIYRQIIDTQYEVAVIVEPDTYQDPRKIPILPGADVRTDFGSLTVNESLRDDFCDEEDDFFIRDDDAYGHLGFFDHVSMLQLVQDNCQVLGMQLLDESPPVVQEMTFVLKEIMPFKNALIVFCCELGRDRNQDFETIKTLVMQENDTRLLNLIYGGESGISGAGIFLAGLMTARHRERKLQFYADAGCKQPDNLLSAYACFPVQDGS